MAYGDDPWDIYGPGEGGNTDTVSTTYQDEGTWPSNIAAPATSYDSFGNPVAAGSAAATSADPTGLAQAQLDANAAAGAGTSGWEKFLNSLKGYGAVGSGASGLLGGLGSLLGSKAGMAGLLALLSAMDRQKATGGGAAQAYAGPSRIPQRTIVQGKYGPIAQYAATGGLMHAYAGGGPIQMEDGGFVMTKRAVDGAGGPQGIRQLIPDARMIRGPGTGTSDSIPAVINSPKGQTPAALSNGEAYVPKDIVERLGGAKRMYDMMHKLQRRA
jgi:hypothetical protein